MSKVNVTTPKTQFSLRIDPKVEETTLAEWNLSNRFKLMEKVSYLNPEFILHDGPPYANGNIHIGHALNKILKDITVRYHYLLGNKVHYVPGWDCHGLPIEWKVEEEYRKNKKDKDLDVVKFRQDCRQYAQKWMDIQKEEFKRLGVLADWSKTYTTMSYKSESKIVEQLHRFLMDNRIFQANKPVMWSPVEKTALAEAEVEYKEITSTSVYVKFPIDKTDLFVAVWTTTPWTLPGNQAIAFSSDINYGVFDTDVGKIVISKKLSNDIKNKFSKFNFLEDFDLSNLKDIKANHPFYNRKVSFYNAAFVNDDQGTGFVHIAPGHGMDDFLLGVENNLLLDSIIDDTGCYRSDIGQLTGVHVYKGNVEVIKLLEEHNNLILQQLIHHEYPHSWRSKKPIIYRTTPQWFIDISGFKNTALELMSTVLWHPTSGEKRLKSMIEKRTEWCISRQRLWGVPIAIFVNRKTGQLLCDLQVNERIINAIQENGCDAWFLNDSNYFLNGLYNPDDYTMVKDILDVWFDSGSTWSFFLEDKVADLYLEGSDQHRGWFQSSLLISVASRGKSPYTNVLTHGFCLDGSGRKMSKSEGNVVAPMDVIEKYGADVLRLWVANSNFTEDLRINDSIIAQTSEAARKFRNTLRFLLGNFNDNDVISPVDYNLLPDLEKYILNQLSVLDEKIKHWSKDFKYNRICAALNEFCNELSSFYFDIRKDSLYCDDLNNLTRKSCLFVMDQIFNYLTLYLMPLMPFTIDEASKMRWPNNENFSRRFIDIPSEYKNQQVFDRWVLVKQIRDVVLKTLELKRDEKVLATNLETKPIIDIGPKYHNIVNIVDLAEVCITSGVEVNEVTDEGIIVTFQKMNGDKCVRCWKYHEMLYEHLCNRCHNVGLKHEK